MLRKIVFLFFTCFQLIAIRTHAIAEDYVSKEQYEQLEKRVLMLEQKLQEQEKCLKDQNCCISEQNQKIAEYESRISRIDEKLHREVGPQTVLAEGLKISAGATMIVQGTDNTNATDEKKENRTDGSYSADITLEKEFKEINGKAFVHLESGSGAGLEDELSLYSNVNRDAGNNDTVIITQFWYEQGFLEDRVALTFGKLDATVYFDNNEMAQDETTQFLGRIFRNNPTIEFPDNTPGARLALMPREWIELDYGMFDGDNDWERIFDNIFNIGQIVLKPKFMGLEGNYRFYGWHNNTYHTEWLTVENQKEAAFGFGLSFDQKVTDAVTLFTRYGWEDPKVYNPNLMASGGLPYSLEHSWSVGFQIEGKLWARENDIFAFAIGQAIPSDDYKNAAPARNAKNEGHLEAYYNFRVNDHLSISPDLQYIWNPFGKDIADDTSPVFVYGLRSQIDF